MFRRRKGSGGTGEAEQAGCIRSVVFRFFLAARTRRARGVTKSGSVRARGESLRRIVRGGAQQIGGESNSPVVYSLDEVLTVDSTASVSAPNRPAIVATSAGSLSRAPSRLPPYTRRILLARSNCVKLDTDTAERTVETLLSRLISLENSILPSTLASQTLDSWYSAAGVPRGRFRASKSGQVISLQSRARGASRGPRGTCRHELDQDAPDAPDVARVRPAQACESTKRASKFTRFAGESTPRRLPLSPPAEQARLLSSSASPSSAAYIHILTKSLDPPHLLGEDMCGYHLLGEDMCGYHLL
eukprot:1179477-Prorocentrum_minimum.AAC.2